MLKLYSFAVFTQLSGAVTAGMIHLGDKLGLYTALAAAGEPVTTDELAAPTRPRRTVGARVGVQPGGGEADRRVDAGRRAEVGGERFSLTPEAVAVLASPDHEAFGMGMFHRFPQTMAALEAMPESFRTGLGHDYDSHGPEGAVGIERSFEPWNRHHLMPTCCPRSTGSSSGWTSGIDVADIGCGAGGAVLLMAAAFPHSTLRRLRHLPLRARPRRVAACRGGARQRALRRPARRADCRRRLGSTSSPRSTASTT